MENLPICHDLADKIKEMIEVHHVSEETIVSYFNVLLANMGISSENRQAFLADVMKIVNEEKQKTM